jgi:transcriptional regulator of acetoin/glycerol metabolism
VRQLVGVIDEMLVLHSEEAKLDMRHLPAKLNDPALVTSRPPPQAPEPGGGSRDDNEVKALIGALRANNGNVVRASEAVGITRRRANYLIEKHGIEPDIYRDATRRDTGAKT